MIFFLLCFEGTFKSSVVTVWEKPNQLAKGAMPF